MPTVKSVCQRIGLRAMIIRFGEQWKTDHTESFERAIKAFYQQYEPFKDRDEPYPPSLETDIDDIIATHGPVLWPDFPDRTDKSSCVWLWRGGEIPEYPADLFYSQHEEKIRGFLTTLLMLRLNVYHQNQVQKRKKAQPKSDSDSELTEFDTVSNGGSPNSLVLEIKLPNRKDDLRQILESDPLPTIEPEPSKKRKAVDTAFSNSKSPETSKRSRLLERHSEDEDEIDKSYSESTIAVRHPYIQGRAIDEASTDENALRVQAGFTTINENASRQQSDTRMQVSDTDSDGDGPVFGRAEVSVHSSSCDSPSEDNQPPETPDEAEPLQYAMPPNTATVLSNPGQLKPKLHGQTDQIMHSEPSAFESQDFGPSDVHMRIQETSEERHQTLTERMEPSLRNLFSPGSLGSGSFGAATSRRPSKRAKRTNALRPLNLARDDHNVTETMSEHSAVSRSPTILCNDHVASFSPVANDTSGSRSQGLVRRTHWGMPSMDEKKDTAVSQTRPNDTPNNAEWSNHHVERLSRSGIFSVSSPGPAAEQTAILQATSEYHQSPASKLQDQLLSPRTEPLGSKPQSPARQTNTTTGTTLSEQLIVQHANLSSLWFTVRLTTADRALRKKFKLDDCRDVSLLFSTVGNRFKSVLHGEAPEEIVFTFKDKTQDDYPIEPDEAGQALWDELLQVLLDMAPQGVCPVEALVTA